MIFGKYDFRCTLLDAAFLPPYKGSTFRGAFGSALKKVVCAVREQECSHCLLSSRCVYARTFEPHCHSAESRARIAAPPHPYVIEPPLGTASRLAEGESFDFSLLLFGTFNDYLPYFIYAFEIMGENGIGKRQGGKRSRFRLDAVLCRGETLYESPIRILKTKSGMETLSVESDRRESGDATLELMLVTPLRIKFSNSFAEDLPFHLLVRTMLRRVSSLFAAYGDGEPVLDYRGLVADAMAVETVSSSLRWHDWERWSNRQEQGMLMGGIVGSISYQGNLAPYLPLLELCQKLHMGKQTAFGLGKIEYSLSGDCEPPTR